MARRLALICQIILAFGSGIWVQSVSPPPVAPTCTYVENQGVRIHFEDGGSGPGLPVVFVHGLAGDLEMWRAQLDHLRKTRRAVALDLRGHGHSGVSKGGDYSIPAMANDIFAVTGALGIGRFVLVGHSMGGAVILAASQARPKAVAGLLFVDPAGDVSRLSKDRLDAMVEKMSSATYKDFMRGWFGASLENGRETTRAMVFAGLERTPREVVRGSFLGLAAFKPAPALDAFEGPMLTVVLPASDRPSSYQNLVGNLPAEKVRNLSHWLMMDAPGQFNAILDRFLGPITK
jgi:pimeloyl-ACP methyl ester carboxylesterase